MRCIHGIWNGCQTCAEQFKKDFPRSRKPLEDLTLADLEDEIPDAIAPTIRYPIEPAVPEWNHRHLYSKRTRDALDALLAKERQDYGTSGVAS